MAGINHWILAPFLAILIAVTAPAAQAQAGNTAKCVIASNDGKNGFRTDEVSGCRVNTANGSTSYVFKGKSKKRAYSSSKPLTTNHLHLARYWLDRVEKLRLNPTRNPIGFDPKVFLSEASKANSGVVFIRTKNGKRALNVVYITDGVYRSIDFPGTNLRAVPSGFLTTGRW
jgi:hypothetical protein